MLIPPRWWRLGALLATASVVAASCSASTPAATHNHHRHQALAPHTTTPSSTTTSGASGNTGTGNTGTGNTGTGNTGTGNTGAGNTGTGNSGSGSTTTTARGPSVSGVTTTTSPVYQTTAQGRLRIRHMGPVISRFKPTSSPTGGTVTIVGRRLAHATAVSIDGLQAAIKANGSSKIKAVVPSGATSGPITVVTPYGSATVYGFIVT
jgi:hypothetical protein